MSACLINRRNLLQTIVHIRDERTGEHVVYNSVRSKRPMPVSTGGTDWLEKIVDETSKTCDFCRPENSSASDEFERLDI